jgi:predicted MFS family arabinose efflux permease
MQQRKWRKESTFDVINLLLGIALISAPWVFGFTSIEMANRNAWIAGAVISVTSIAALVSFAEWEEWVNLVLGLWVAISPWALSSNIVISETAVRAQVALGLVIAVLAAVELWMTRRAPPRITA